MATAKFQERYSIVGRLILVRHGQASAFTDDYDRLSEKGGRQARLLGEWWTERGLKISSVFFGPLKRQKGTAEIVIEELERSGIRVPGPVFIEGLKEIEADRIMAHFDRVKAEYPEMDRLIRAYGESNDHQERGTIFQEYFERGMLLWASGKAEAPDIESISEFRDRVLEALQTIMSSRRASGDTVVFSSAGPVTIMAGHLLGLDSIKTLELTFRLRNCSVTEFALISRGAVLQQFNCTGHLPADLVTIR